MRTKRINVDQLVVGDIVNVKDLMVGQIVCSGKGYHHDFRQISKLVEDVAAQGTLILFVGGEAQFSRFDNMVTIVIAA
ncbi:hypothetical protein [Shewanella sediminis]|uniref:hypothetical protein n=1 Tax=Shewanella sediminis TaxID=271097 RepID=UPI00031E618D|nr:hypothetical protein [Shewanella sediminis]